MTILNIILSILVAVSFAISWFVTTKRRHYEEFARASEKFFKSATLLVEDPDTPDFIVDLILNIRKYVNRQDAAKLFYEALQMIENDKTNEDPSMPEFTAALLRLKQNPELAEAFVDASSSGLMAISYRNMYYGWRLRKNVFRFMRARKEIAPTVAASIRSKLPRNHTPLPDGPCPV
ncbi:hypothetical protein SAMN04515647_4406 [Cohaesibacter sp. ES.047]|uniref:hypothetical protein n=1 Tax=Cohaesibacter sp. ES.047 TaxID=1798205 RepID=UPI000BB7B0AB|nr:hypothetical protein [Cohaesibacter sp. ES.047]SNY94083.1 hypothetical protein SAMN04515647_4406 [Cohaesibacter sp. ES.047]